MILRRNRVCARWHQQTVDKVHHTVGCINRAWYGMVACQSNVSADSFTSTVSGIPWISDIYAVKLPVLWIIYANHFKRVALERLDLQSVSQVLWVVNSRHDMEFE